MKVNVIAIRYARSLVKLMGTDPEVVKQNLDVFEGLASLFAMKEAVSILKSPVMPLSLKGDLLTAVFQRAKAPTPFIQFIEVLLASSRVELIPEIHQAYKMQIDEVNNRVRAAVSSSEELTTQQQNAIREALERVFNKTVEAKYVQDPQLLGGFVAKIGHYQIDCSLRSRIEAILSNAAATSGA